MIVQSAVLLDGKIYTGHRHANILQEMVQLRKPFMHGVQGFVDEHGTFYNRIDAAEHALACGQISHLQWPPNLYSEDLY